MELDGSLGEGGGQILRTALSLALCTGKTFRIEHIRARRRNPGLMRQHLTAVQAAAEISGAETEGARLNSQTLLFAPGKIKAGEYRFAVRYYNRNTGALSNWSPLSKPLTIIDNKQVFLSNIPVSSNPQVNARQIGATQPDGGIIYLVGQIDDNVTTTYYENALSPDEYGEADVDVNGNPTTDIRHGTPPDQAWALEKHKERLFVLNKDGLFWSEVGRFQSFKASSFLPVVRGTGLISWDQHGLVIATDKEAQILLGDTPGDWRIDLLSKEHGCPAGKSMAIGDGTLFWYTGTNIVASSGGAPALLPGIERIRETLEDIADADKADVVGETIPARGWYVLSAETSAGRVAIIYDYKENRFAGVITDAPKTIARLLSVHDALTPGG